MYSGVLLAALRNCVTGTRSHFAGCAAATGSSITHRPQRWVGRRCARSRTLDGSKATISTRTIWAADLSRTGGTFAMLMPRMWCWTWSSQSWSSAQVPIGGWRFAVVTSRSRRPTSRRSLPPWACSRRKHSQRGWNEARVSGSTIADALVRSSGKSGLSALEDIQRLAATAADGASALRADPLPVRGSGDRDLVRRRGNPDSGADLPALQHRSDDHVPGPPRA